MESLTFDELSILKQHGIVLRINNYCTLVEVSRAFLKSEALQSFLSSKRSDSRGEHNDRSTRYGDTFKDSPEEKNFGLSTRMSAPTAFICLGFESWVAHQLSVFFELRIKNSTLLEFIKEFIDTLDPAEHLESVETLRLMGAGAGTVGFFQQNQFSGSIGIGAHE